MEHQYPPPFPFDALDASGDFGAADIFPIPAHSGDAHASLRAIQRKLRELDGQLRVLLSLIDQELAGAIAPTPSSSSPPSVHPPRDPIPDMPATRSLEPLTSTLQARDTALRVIEGVFDGQHMIGPDGKQYSVPANYASKSKLVEGDILKLSITPRGAFVYKQIGPIPRDRRIGVLERDDVTGEYVVLVPDADEDRSALTRAVTSHEDLPTNGYRRYRTLRASVTFHHGSPGDEVVIIVPKGTPSTWAAVENIMKR